MPDDKRILICREFASDIITPAQAYQALAKPSHVSTLITVNEGDDYKSYLGFYPIAIFSSKNRQTTLTYRENAEVLLGNPYDELQLFFQRFKPEGEIPQPKFADGYFGFVSYDAVRLVEELPDQQPDLDQVPDLLFYVFETVIIFDHRDKKFWIIKSVHQNEEAERSIESIYKQINEHKFAFTCPTKGKELDLTVEIEDEDYRQRVQRIKEYIREGQIFQMVISRAFTTPVKATPFQIYMTLIGINPSPYMFLFETGQFAIVGASPEKLVTVTDGQIETIPVGGTYPRDPHKNDAERCKELLADPKELAEHIMKMEVARNDLSALSEPGSVEILELAGTRIFSHVIHIVTKIRGRLQSNKTPIDVLKTMLPAAPISGSPKKRALALIDTVEKSRRGFYSGAICLTDTQGNLLTCLTIRTLFIKDGIAKMRSGATIVAYSDPNLESQESRHKAGAPLQALKLIEGSIA